MNEHQINPEPGNQQNQPLEDNLTDNQTQSGTFQKEDSEISDRTSQQEFPERIHEHEHKNPSANQNEDDEDDDVNTDEAIFDKDDKTDTDPVDEQTDVSNLGLV